MQHRRFITLLAAFWAAAALADGPATVSIDSGQLAGTSAAGVNTFKGIPYAKPPVGNLRWQPPQPPAHWNGVRDATKFQLPCTQPTDADGKTPNGGGVWGRTSEDCLYLNVFAPANAKDAPPCSHSITGASFAFAGAKTAKRSRSTA